jgi:hypothetical protein
LEQKVAVNFKAFFADEKDDGDEKLLDKPGEQPKPKPEIDDILKNATTLRMCIPSVYVSILLTRRDC